MKTIHPCRWRRMPGTRERQMTMRSARLTRIDCSICRRENCSIEPKSPLARGMHEGNRTGACLQQLAEFILDPCQIVEIEAERMKIIMLQCVDLTAPTDAGDLVALRQQAPCYREPDTGTGAGNQCLFSHASAQGW